MQNIAYAPAQEAAFLANLRAFIEQRTGEAIDEAEFAELAEVDETIEIASIVSDLMPEKGKAKFSRFSGDSFVIELPSSETAATVASSLEEAGFLTDFAGDVVLARRSPHRVRAAKRAKRKFGAKRKPIVATPKPSAGPRSSAGGLRGEVPRSTVMQLHVLNDEWSTKALRRMFTEHVGSTDYRYFLQFLADVDAVAGRYVKLCGTTKKTGDDDGKADTKEAAAAEHFNADLPPALDVQIPFDFLKPQVDLAAVQVEVEAAE